MELHILPFEELVVGGVGSGIGLLQPGYSLIIALAWAAVGSVGSGVLGLLADEQLPLRRRRRHW